jgi:hypothetical protein
MTRVVNGGVSIVVNDRPLIAYVEWRDAGIAADRWEDRAAVLNRAKRITTDPIRSAGIVLHEDETHVVLAVNRNDNNDDVALVEAIPRSAIIRFEKWDES